MTSRITLSCFIMFIRLTAAPATQTQADSRFDGIWVGTEALSSTSSLSPDQRKKIPPPYKVTVAIAKNGTLLGIIGPVCWGRYPRVHHADGALTVQNEDCKRTFTLSPDGKTLIEQGSYNFATMYTVRQNARWPVSWLPLGITGTFHRLK
jgi:hypothetical protein